MHLRDAATRLTTQKVKVAKTITLFEAVGRVQPAGVLEAHGSDASQTLHNTVVADFEILGFIYRERLLACLIAVLDVKPIKHGHKVRDQDELE